ncbi:MAG TPA: hypothetical protein VFJ94_10785 [Intrasporangium sp.]|uniref:hypothetical protein n=1 Tax=Intrasporangium sp. TaxID=1925024 RepID=UPI002D76D4F4|nr:hypothetical protein [Intrasporangium sp.]HET7398996.1 hypothetical protein [Intrasporangium sp.]
METVRSTSGERTWVAKICEDLGYDPREVCRIKMDAHVVTVTCVRRDEAVGDRWAHVKIEHPIVGHLLDGEAEAGAQALAAAGQMDAAHADDVVATALRTFVLTGPEDDR